MQQHYIGYYIIVRRKHEFATTVVAYSHVANAVLAEGICADTCTVGDMHKVIERVRATAEPKVSSDLGPFAPSGGCWYCDQDDEESRLEVCCEFDTNIHVKCIKERAENPAFAGDPELEIIIAEFKDRDLL
jgi:hypothetical protein